MRPVGAELEFHRNPGHNPEHEIDAKNPSPETGRLVVHGIVAPQSNRLEHNDEQGKPHGELREEIVKRSGEGEVKAVNEKCAVHK